MLNDSVNFDPVEQRSKIHEILDIVLDCNGFGRRKCEITDDLPTCFLYFSGHIAQLEVHIHEDGWYPKGDCLKFYFSTDTDISKNKIEALRQTALAALEGEE